ncbi:MAG: type II toxin-antitoxin system PemK/MazF family toxin [Chitinophagaceae bacterium]|nr:MAG: type II toxin-antitoxin system PemK/MazF family toxin [Chitinophagaceae bacterium]
MASNKNFNKWDIVLVNLDPTKGSEMSKTRPCVIISPNTLNKNLHTLIIAPLTSSHKRYPCRISTNINNSPGEVCLDHIKSIDKSRVIKLLGELDKESRNQAVKVLLEMFKE